MHQTIYMNSFLLADLSHTHISLEDRLTHIRNMLKQLSNMAAYDPQYQDLRSDLYIERLRAFVQNLTVNISPRATGVSNAVYHDLQMLLAWAKSQNITYKNLPESIIESYLYLSYERVIMVHIIDIIEYYNSLSPKIVMDSTCIVQYIQKNIFGGFSARTRHVYKLLHGLYPQRKTQDIKPYIVNNRFLSNGKCTDITIDQRLDSIQNMLNLFPYCDIDDAVLLHDHIILEEIRIVYIDDFIKKGAKLKPSQADLSHITNSIKFDLHKPLPIEHCIIYYSTDNETMEDFDNVFDIIQYYNIMIPLCTAPEDLIDVTILDNIIKDKEVTENKEIIQYLRSKFRTTIIDDIINSQ